MRKIYTWGILGLLSLANTITEKALAEAVLTTPEPGDFLNIQPQFSIEKPQIAHPELIPHIPELSQVTNSDTAKFQIFPVGLSVGKKIVIFSLPVRGQENGVEAIAFEDWLLPYNEVIQALKLTTTTLPDGLIELKNSQLILRINPKQLHNDADLGLVLSIKELQNLFGVKAKFDIEEYAIQLNLPWLDKPVNQVATPEAPIELEGLPKIHAPEFSLAAVEQKIEAVGTGSSSGTVNYKGGIGAIGTIFGGSWFLRANQSNLEDLSTWTISEAQFLRQTNSADYILGSQIPFWLTDSEGEFWGLTTIQRWGSVLPPISRSGGGSLTTAGGGMNSEQRLQASQIGRRITGEAEPGTLVRLTQGFGDRILAEVLVSSSGIYEFDNVPVGNGAGNYRILLYPQGQLTRSPLIRTVLLSALSSQLPTGSTALVVSGGMRRKLTTNSNLWGDFSDFRGGIAQRWGVSESLTLGVGAIYDRSGQGLGELFWQPKNLPIAASVSVLAGNKLEVNSDIRFQPFPSLIARFNSDRFNNRFNLDWQVFSGLSLFATLDSRQPNTVGIQFSNSGTNRFTFLRAVLNSQNYLRWYLLQRFGSLEFAQRGSEIGILSELSYNLSENQINRWDQQLVLGYETRNLNNQNNELVSLNWRYISPERAIDGRPLWQAEIGYGMGSNSSGIIASLETAIIPGLLLRSRYQGISLSYQDSSFRIELLSTLNFQSGINPGTRTETRLRHQGGIDIQLFLDSNQNGRQDPGEAIYTDTLGLLLILNNQPIKTFNPQDKSQHSLVLLSPGNYRLEFDPAGFPPNWQTTKDAYAIEVAAGDFTHVTIPLIPAYTISGTIADASGKPVPGVKVEAIDKTSGQSIFSITNTAGIYYLERLQQGTYKLQINGKPAQPNSIKLDSSSKPFQNIEIWLENREATYLLH